MEPLRSRVWLVDLFAAFFGIGAWISVNGLWVELPLLVQSLPEGWALPSYMSIVIQVANIGPIIYSIGRFAAPKLFKDVWVVYVLMAIGVLSSLLMALLWQETSLIDGVERSTALLILLFFLSLVDCTSSVLFMPFMARFQKIYLTSYLIGEGLSGFLPSLLALAQGVGGNPECRNVTDDQDSFGKLEPFYPEPRFSVSDFFFILLAMMVCSAVAFILLNHTSVARRERVQTSVHQTSQTPADNPTFVSSSDRLHPPVVVEKAAINAEPENPNDADKQKEGVQNRRSISPIPLASTSSDSDLDDDETHLSRSIFFYLLFIQAWVCALSNGFLPSIQSYSCLPYGNVAYHLAVTLSSMANPLACLIAYFLPITNVLLITVFSFVGTCISAYIILLAALSPEPLLVSEASGEALMVVAWILCIGILTYVKVSVASILRLANNKGQRNLFWYGVSTQVGSTIGSIIAFVLVNVSLSFQAYYPCV